MAADKNKTNKTEPDPGLHLLILKQMATLATSGFGLVAALAWNNVIKDLVDNYIAKWLPGGSGFISLLIYAIVVTVIAVVVTTNLTKTINRLEKK